MTDNEESNSAGDSAFENLLRQLLDVHRKEVRDAQTKHKCDSCVRLRQTLASYRAKAESLLEDQEKQIVSLKKRIYYLERAQNISSQSQEEIYCPNTPENVPNEEKEIENYSAEMLSEKMAASESFVETCKNRSPTYSSTPDTKTGGAEILEDRKSDISRTSAVCDTNSTLKDSSPSLIPKSKILPSSSATLVKGAEQKKKLGSPVFPENFRAKARDTLTLSKSQRSNAKSQSSASSPSRKRTRQSKLSDQYYLSIQKVRVADSKQGSSTANTDEAPTDSAHRRIIEGHIKHEWREAPACQSSEDLDLTPSILIPPQNSESPLLRKPLSPKNLLKMEHSTTLYLLSAENKEKTAIGCTSASKRLKLTDVRDQKDHSSLLRCTPDLVALNIDTESEEHGGSPSLMASTAAFKPIAKSPPCGVTKKTFNKQKITPGSSTSDTSAKMASTANNNFPATNGHASKPSTSAEGGDSKMVAGVSKVEKAVVDEGVLPKVIGSPVRKKADRQLLRGFDCKDCKKFYESLKGVNSDQLQEVIQKCSRHRARHSPPSTPNGFWDLDIPDTPELRSRGLVPMETQKCDLVFRRKI